RHVPVRLLHSFPTRRSSDLQDPRRVGDRLAPPELDVARRKEEGVSAQLIGADLKGDARAGARLGEDHGQGLAGERRLPISPGLQDRKSTRLNSSHLVISYAV